MIRIQFIKNAQEIMLRLRRNLHADRPLNILDVGSAYGNALKFYRDNIPSSVVYGIEAAPRGQHILVEELGGILVAEDFDDECWAESYESKFDLITMRHVFEHLLYPNEALRKLKSILADNGLIYLSLPDTLHPRIKLRDYEDWWDYWFRVVHPFYYNKYRLGKLLVQNGFDVIDYSEENCELWMVIGLGCDTNLNDEFNQDESVVLEKQVDVFDRYLADFSLSDYV